jgi:uncharacterized protein (TIGR02391 family)
MYLSTTLAGQTLTSINEIWSTYNELCGVLDGIATYLAEGGDEAYPHDSYGEQERKEHLVRCVCSLEEEVKKLSQLYPAENLNNVFQRTLSQIQEIHRLLSEFELAEVVSVPWIPSSRDALQSRVAELEVFHLAYAISEHIQRTTSLSGQPADLITPELVRQNPQAAVQQVFTLFEDRIRKRIDAGPDLYGQSLINAAFGKKGVLIYGETPAEREGIRNLLSGAYSTFRNPHMHRLMEDDEKTVLAIITLVDLLIKIVDEAKPSS